MLVLILEHLLPSFLILQPHSSYLRIIMDVLIFIVFLISLERNEDWVVSAKDLSLVLKILVEELLPEVILLRLKRHSALISFS
jgi:hypothetical protein